MSTIAYLYKASLTNPDKKREFDFWGSSVGWMSWCGFYRYNLDIDKKTRMVHFYVVNGITKDVRANNKFPYDISTEEEYFQYSLIYEIPFTLEEFNEIKQLLGSDYEIPDKPEK